MLHKLTVNSVQLVDLIDSNSAFIDKLGAVTCITWPQREHLINIVQPRQRNVKLLEFLARRSVADFRKFTSVLAEEQPHLVSLLITDGGETFYIIHQSYDKLSLSPIRVHVVSFNVRQVRYDILYVRHSTFEIRTQHENQPILLNTTSPEIYISVQDTRAYRKTAL